MGDRARLTGVSAGDIVTVENEHGRVDRVMILGRCASVRGYHCLRHGVALANAHQLEAHIETTSDREHVIASHCQRHGLEAFDAAAFVATAVDHAFVVGVG